MKRTFVFYNLTIIFIVISLFMTLIFTLTSVVYQSQSERMLRIILEDTLVAYNQKTVSDELFVIQYQNTGKRISILNPDGLPIADSMLLSVGGNQSTYPEIINLEKPFRRYSESLKMHLMYIATTADNQNYVRVAIVMDDDVAINNQTIIGLIVLTGISLIISYFLLKKTSYIFVRPIKEIVKSLKSINENRYEWAMPASNYDEINDLLREINHINEQIVSQIDNLAFQEAELEILLNHMHQGLLLVGSDNKIVLSNQLSKKWLDLDSDSSLYQIRNKELYETIIKATQTKTESILKFNYKDEIIQVVIKSVDSKILIKDKNPFGVLVIMVDDTNRIKLEQNKRDFFANASHELRTPLTAIKGSAELMLYNMANEKEKEKLSDEIIKQVETMDNLIKDMLELSRLETRPSTDKTSIDLRQLLDHVLTTLNPQVKQKEIHVNVETDKVVYAAIESDIRALFKNLIENAIKYNKPLGSIDISLKEDTHYILFKVSDTGIGIPKNQHDRIFERFYQVNKSRSKSQNGTGLGLAIVKHVVMHYNGTIEIDSTLDVGTTFIVKLKK